MTRYMTRYMTRAALTLLAAALLLPSAAGARKLRTLAPPGWKAEGRVQTFDRKTVFSAINGAAELYLSYGMTRLQLHPIRKGELKLTVHIYELGSHMDALGVYLRERPERLRPIKQAGVKAGFATPGHCLAFGDFRYLRLQVRAGTLTAAVCQEVLGHMARTISLGDKAPAALALLPAKGRVAGSLGFTRQSFLGLRELSGCLHARYGSGKKTHTRFVMIAPDDKAVEAARERLLRKKWKSTRVGDRAVMYRAVPYKGTVAVARVKAGFIGLAGAGDHKTTLKMMGGM